MTTTLNNGDRINIEAEDVVTVFDFSSGKEKIQVKRWEKDQNQLVREWYACFDVKKKVVPPLLADKMLTETDGGDWFKRHFVLLVHACLIDINLDGYIHPLIMHHLKGMDNVRNLDWQGYLLECLYTRKSK